MVGSAGISIFVKFGGVWRGEKCLAVTSGARREIFGNPCRRRLKDLGIWSSVRHPISAGKVRRKKYIVQEIFDRRRNCRENGLSQALVMFRPLSVVLSKHELLCHKHYKRGVDSEIPKLEFLRDQKNVRTEYRSIFSTTQIRKSVD